ncbi:hypothetical protein QYE76_037538 [Lolium multiflorum]|uniref:DDE Tnp4 domain-containing protein n=1 Tax=Lolium multiflorum TaxID=4521 RepID=A0AAD8QG51_LOLMU|nr:hypothetical protein QYE76_037538 [Lolium multiflorum]
MEDGEGAGPVVGDYIIGGTSYSPSLSDNSIPRARPIFGESGVQQAMNRCKNGGGAMARLKERCQLLKRVLWRHEKHRLPRIIYACCLLTNITIDCENSQKSK